MTRIGKHNLELISLHIPKTAGTSFRNILKDVYGNKSVVRFDVSHKGEITMDEKSFTKNSIPGKIKVIHGHFYYKDLKNIMELPHNMPVITWIRNPVDRVISNYFYLESVLIEVLNEEKRALNIRSKMQKTLLEYAQAEMNRNRISKFLAGIDLTKLFFIGIQEYFSEDLDLLSGKMGWDKNFTQYRHNETIHSNPAISLEIREEIENLNWEDMELYSEAIRIRASHNRQ